MGTGLELLLGLNSHGNKVMTLKAIFYLCYQLFSFSLLHTLELMATNGLGHLPIVLLLN